MVNRSDSVVDRARRRRSAIVFGAIAIAAAVVLTLTIFVQAGASSARSTRLAWAAGSLVVTALLVAGLLAEVLRRSRTDRATIRVDRLLREVPRSSGDDVGRRALPSLLEDLASSAARAFGAAAATIVLDGEGPHLEVTGSGSTSLAPEGANVAAADGGRVSLDHHLGSDLVCEARRIGSLDICARPSQGFRNRHRMLLHVLAPRMAAHIELVRLAGSERQARLATEQARLQLDVLARASVPLAPALEHPEDAITEIADVVIPEFADLFAVDLVRDGGRLERIVAAYSDAAIELQFDQLSGELPDWSDTVRRVMTTGVSELEFSRDEDDIPPQSDRHSSLMHQLGMQSWVVAPIWVRGASLGTMTLATRQSRRGYRPADQVTIDDLVARTSVAFERGLLYQEAQQATREAASRADQLARLVPATIALNRTLEPSALLHALVEQAASVLDAPYAHAQLDDDQGPEAEYGPRLEHCAHITSPLVGAQGEVIGRLTVTRPRDHPFGDAARAAITMLAESASVAHRQAELYKDVSDREQRLKALIEASPLAILELDLSGEVLVANPAARTLFPVSDPTGIELVEPPIALVERLADLMSSTVRGERQEAELTTADGAGDRRDLWVSTAPVGGGHGDPVRMLAVITDMTSRRHLEAQLVDAQRYEAIAALAGGVAHDFNNLLTVILGYSEILLHDLSDASTEFESVEAIQEAGKHAAVITNQLLALSRHQVVQPETIDAVARCEALMPMLRRLAGPTVIVEGHLTGAARISVDPGQLEQVLFNLVFNSRDAMPEGGHLDIEVGERIEPDRSVATFVRVADTGEGMDPATLARCREPFFTTKGRDRGNGLGLATVASIVHAAGGLLEINSELSCGTTMTVVFPSAVAEEQPAPEVAPVRGQRVLLVDDDEKVRQFTARVLIEAGYEVIEVGDGQTAIATLERELDFDLLVTDVALPAMTGAEVVRIARDRWPGVASLLITGFADTPTLDADIGDTTVVPKPFTPEVLLRAAARALHGIEDRPPIATAADATLAQLEGWNR